MNVYIWEYVAKCTDNYHSEGGVVVFAEFEERARELAKEKGCTIAEDELPVVREVVWGEEYVYVFPDAGCC